MTIHWFPGHMTRAKREIEEKVKMVDMIIECRDSRIPLASQNPLLQTLTQNKPRLIVLTKKDKADPLETERWIKELSKNGTLVIAIDLFHDDVSKRIVEGCKLVMKPKFDRWISKGIRPRSIKAMVLGIPNVGKSTLINQLGKRKVMVTADRPGVTMSMKWAKVHPDLDLLDTPGVLWPKFDDKEVAMNLALTGAIKENVLPLEEIAFAGYQFICQYYPDRLQKKYDTEYLADPVAFFTEIATRRSYFKNKEADFDRAMGAFLRELRQDSLGRVTFEHCV